ncbi:uncharacterized protein [Linepithema humile]|uniref:uncharacterized protein n=1 Tax=Linepithema humile TaxID=83485 RepID=UPI00351F4DB1
MNRQRQKTLMFGMALLLSNAYAACVLLRNKKKNKRKPRRYAVRPLNRKRHETGHFFSLMKDMLNIEYDQEQFFKYTRCSPSQFNELLQLVGPKLQKDIRRNPFTLSPAHRLTLTLHYLAEGCSMQEIARNFRIGKTTAHVIIKETCQILWNVLQPSVLKRPEADDWKNIAQEFYRRWNMPNCIGAIDGKHINVIAPKNTGTEFFNYKKSFSIVLMAICDAYYRFIFVDIGAAGSNHDSIIFKECTFGKALQNRTLQIPEPCDLPGSNIKFNHYIVADQAFPLDKHIMRPYPGNNLGEEKNIFNYRLSRARRTIENAFGILVQRWRILRKEIISSVETCEEIVMAAIVLHNFLQKSAKDIPEHERRYVETGVREYINENGVFQSDLCNKIPCDLRSVGRLGSNNPSRTAKEARDKLADYLISVEGSVPWQWEYVRQGNVP